jgi:hypothetical protein
LETDVNTLRHIAMRLKLALQDGSGLHMRRLFSSLSCSCRLPLTFTAQGSALYQVTAHRRVPLAGKRHAARCRQCYHAAARMFTCC